MSVTAAASGRFLPVHTVNDWLAPAQADALLEHAIASETQYRTAEIIYQGRRVADTEIRNCVTLGSLGALEGSVRERALGFLPALQTAFGTPTFTPTRIEIELAAHGDGAHFDRHIDTLVVTNRGRTPRLVTLVLYLHRRPRPFTGGEIRMYALGSAESYTCSPNHNTLVAFPSIAPHSVERVCCASGEFCDRRFAINMWIHG